MKRKSMITKLVAAACCVGLLLTGCGSRAAADSSADAAPAAEASESGEASGAVTGAGMDIKTEPIKVGLSVAQMDANPVRWEQGCREVCDQYSNIEFNVYDAQGSAETQVQQFHEMINEGYNIIVYNPADSAALDAVTTEAESAGIKTININMGANAPHTGSIEADVYTFGVLSADDAAEQLGGKGKAVAIAAPLALAAVVPGADGFEDECPKVGLEFLEAQNGDWTTENANTIMRDFLSKYNNDIQAVFCQNDQMAFGAAQAIEAAGLTGKILVYGCDGLSETKAYLESNQMRGTWFMDNVASGRNAVKLGLYALQFGLDGSKLASTPVFSAEFKLVTPENVNDYIK